MNDPLQTILQLTSKANLFPVNSRYHGSDTDTMETADGKTIVYLSRRFVPRPEEFSLVQEHSISQGDRLDNLAAHYLGDPELWWRLCDANTGVRPDELTEGVGQKLRITLPEGIPGVQNE